MISVEDAQQRILAAFAPVGAELVALDRAFGRVLAGDQAARRSQPPVAVSAMDGYAVRAGDVADLPIRLRVVGQAPAGHPFSGRVGAGEAVRIFTGAAVPEGADAVVIQENTKAAGDMVEIVDGKASAGANVRKAGLDFAAGEMLLEAGRRLTARDVGLAAAMNLTWLEVRRRPRVAILTTGDEIALPGDQVGLDRIVGSNAFALAALVRAWGGAPTDLGIARDDLASLKEAAAGAAGFDLLVTSGGASVGDHDLVQRALREAGMQLEFWKVAVRPGKPLMFGQLGAVPVLGLPGNPVSAIVCALLFLRPALERLAGQSPGLAADAFARLGRALPANNDRQDYLRANFTRDAHGDLVAIPHERQDSSMLSVLARADGLVVRPPLAPAAKKGERVPVYSLPSGAVFAP